MAYFDSGKCLDYKTVLDWTRYWLSHGLVGFKRNEALDSLGDLGGAYSSCLLCSRMQKNIEGAFYELFNGIRGEIYFYKFIERGFAGQLDLPIALIHLLKKDEKIENIFWEWYMDIGSGNVGGLAIDPQENILAEWGLGIFNKSKEAVDGSRRGCSLK